MDTGTKIPSGAGDPEGVEPSMEELRSFWDVPSRIALVIGADHRVRRANEGAVRAANRDPADVVGRTIKELMPFSRDVIEAIVDRVIASGAPASGTISAIDFAEMTLDVFPIAVRSEDPRALLIATDPRHIPFDEPDGANATRTSYFDYLQRLACVSSADSAALIEETLRYIVQTYRLKRAYVRLLTDDEACFRTEYEYYPPEIGPVSPREITVTSIAWANERFLRGESIVLSSPDDLPSDDQDFRAALERVNVRATISVPVLDGPRLFGYVAYPAEEGRSWSTLDVNRLRLLGEVIAAVLVRNRAERDLQDRFRFEEQLAAATMRVVGIEPEAVDAELERTLAAVGASCNFDRALISRLNDAGDTVSITHEWCAPGVPSIRARFQGKRLDELSSFARRALAGEDVVGREEDAAPGSELAQLLRALQIHGIVISPLHIEGRVGGLFTVQTCGHHRFDPPAYVARVRLTADVIAAAHSERAARERARRIDAEKQRAFEAVSREKQTLERERDYLREERGSREIVGESPAIQRALDLLIAVASTTSSVLLLGESGVGKEVFAAAVHARSARSRGPFVKVNCASVPSTLFESEFFGHAKGSFTGAMKDRAGRFELADGGTLFLDEVGEIPLDLQAKLLRVLQEGEIERVGEDKTRKVDVRIVAATNRDLSEEVKAGRFRRDLYFRLGVFPIHIPPLRDRGTDVLLLARHFLRRRGSETRGRAFELTADDEARLLSYEWPGNVRELDHVLERAVILSRAPPLRLDLVLPYRGVPSSGAATDLLREDDLRRLERENLTLAMKKAGGRIAGSGGAAELLGMHPSTLRDRLKAFGISRTE